MKSLHELHPDPRAQHKRKRVGRGESSGHGKTSGRGGKGQTARSGHKRKYQFEGGQMGLARRVPKFGFTSEGQKRTDVAIINLSQLNVFPTKSEVSVKGLIEKGLVPKLTRVVRVLAKGKLDHALTIKANHFSKSALAKIAAVHGVAEVL